MTLHPVATDPPEPHTPLFFADDRAVWLGEWNARLGTTIDYVDRQRRAATHWGPLDWPDPPREDAFDRAYENAVMNAWGHGPRP